MAVIVDKNKCISCGGCVSVCPIMALELVDKFPSCNHNKCTNCNICVKFCPAAALALKK